MGLDQLALGWLKPAEIMIQAGFGALHPGWPVPTASCTRNGKAATEPDIEPFSAGGSHQSAASTENIAAQPHWDQLLHAAAPVESSSLDQSIAPGFRTQKAKTMADAVGGTTSDMRGMATLLHAVGAKPLIGLPVLAQMSMAMLSADHALMASDRASLMPDTVPDLPASSSGVLSSSFVRARFPETIDAVPSGPPISGHPIGGAEASPGRMLSGSPGASQMSYGASSPQGPMPVYVVNGRDLANGMTSHMAQQLDCPRSGIAGPDTYLSPWSMLS